uniref:Uncharacterized protein n=1 Tax=Timema genevievae TaxID=629358 RepID=A0A7R9K413_TIMGE|nr:unnamed protein product [Timema genevievae]
MHALLQGPHKPASTPTPPVKGCRQVRNARLNSLQTLKTGVTRFARVDSSSESVDVEGLSSGPDLPLMRDESSQGSNDELEGFQTSGDNGGPGQGAPALSKGEKRRKPKGKNASCASPQPGTSGSGPAPKAKGKIPPIILCDVEDYSKCGSEEDYRALQKFLPSLGIQHWSYELGRERLVRVVVKGLLTRTSPDDIQEELAEMGFPVKSVSQMLSQWKRDQRTGERQRLPNFVVSLTPGEQTARLYSISVLCGLRVKVEKYKSPGGPVQCKNCFRFGHVRRDCRANPRCGFCGGDHERGGCPEERRSPPKCLHCSGAHSSAWRGCPTYKSLRAAGTVRASKVSEGRTDGLSEGQKPSGHVAVRKVTVTPAPKPKPLVQSFASALSGRPTPPSQAEAPAKATLPEPVASGSSLTVEDPSKTAPLPIPSLPTPAPRTTLPKPLHPSNPFLPLPTPTPVNPATPTPNPTPEDDATKLKICIELLKEIPGLDPWDFSSSLLRKVQESPRSNPICLTLSLSTITIPLTATHVAGTSSCSTTTNVIGTSFRSTTTNVAGTSFCSTATHVDLKVQDGLISRVFVGSFDKDLRTIASLKQEIEALCHVYRKLVSNNSLNITSVSGSVTTGAVTATSTGMSPSVSVYEVRGQIGETIACSVGASDRVFCYECAPCCPLENLQAHYLTQARQSNWGLDRIVFRDLLHNTFDLVTEEVLMDRIFCAFDRCNLGVIRLEEWVTGLSVFLRGTFEERTTFCFLVYDLNSDGFISRDEMFHLLSISLPASLQWTSKLSSTKYMVPSNQAHLTPPRNSGHQNCLVKQPQDEDPDEGVKDLVELALRKLDQDKDGKVSFSDFQIAVKEEPLLMEAFGQCLPVENSCQTFISTLRC